MESLFLPIKRPGLFRSSAWLFAWLKTWGNHPGIDLSVNKSFASMDNRFLQESELESAIFKINEPLLRFFSVLTAYPCGVSSRSTGSIRSEYFQLPLDPLVNPAAATDYLKSVLAHKWDRLILPDLLHGSADYKSIIPAANLQKLTVIRGGSEATYGVNVTLSTFEDYVKGLGKNSRLKLFNLRKKLERFGSIKVENIWPDRERFFDLLNAFHTSRWGKPCYRDHNLIFINMLLDELPNIGGEINFSVMTIDAVPVSVVFDVLINGRVYNLQAGYRENFAKGIALGTLHLGYQIEAAFQHTQVEYYDFMAGRGKNSNYKKSLSNSSAEFVTLTLVRNPLLSVAYKIKAWLQGLAFFRSATPY